MYNTSNMLASVFRREFFADRSMMIFSGLISIALLAIVFRVLSTVKQYDFKIAVRYTQYGIDPFPLGDWYSLYDMAAFAVVSSVVVLLIAMRLHAAQRSLAVIVLGLHLVVMVFLVIVSNAILSTTVTSS